MITKMYLLYNVIPLIFGNKQTIEFRIHTPTYDVNKIIPFIFMNSLIVNFTIKHQEKILKNKSFLKDCNISEILYSQLEVYNIHNKDQFRNLIYDYIEKRKDYCEMQILKGNILGTESEIPAPTSINWSDSIVIKKNPYSFPDSFNKSIQYKPRKSYRVSTSKPLSKEQSYNNPFNTEELLSILKNSTSNTTFVPLSYDNGTKYYDSVISSIEDSPKIIDKIEQPDNSKIQADDLPY